MLLMDLASKLNNYMFGRLGYQNELNWNYRMPLDEINVKQISYLERLNTEFLRYKKKYAFSNGELDNDYIIL